MDTLKNSKTIITLLSILLSTFPMVFVRIFSVSVIEEVLEEKNEKLSNNIIQISIFSFLLSFIVVFSGYNFEINYNISKELVAIMVYIIFVTLIVTLIVILIILIKNRFRKTRKMFIIYYVSLCIINFLTSVVFVNSENIIEVKDLFPLVLIFGLFYILLFTRNLLNRNVTRYWETNIILNSINSRLSQLVLLYNLSNGKQIYVEKKDIGKKEHELHTFYVFYKTEKYLQCYTLYDDVKETNQKKRKLEATKYNRKKTTFFRRAKTRSNIKI